MRVCLDKRKNQNRGNCHHQDRHDICAADTGLGAGKQPPELGRGAAAGGRQNPQCKTRPYVARGQGDNDIRHAGDADHVAYQSVEDAEPGDQDDGDKEHHRKRLIIHESGRERVGEQKQRAQRKVDPASNHDDGLTDSKVDEWQTVFADRCGLELAECRDQSGIPDEQCAEQQPDAQCPSVARQTRAP